MTVASFIAFQRTEHGVPHTVACRALDVCRVDVLQVARPPTDTRQVRRNELDAAVLASFEDSGGTLGPTGRPGCARTSSRLVGGLSKKSVAGLDGPPGPRGPLPETSNAVR